MNYMFGGASFGVWLNSGGATHAMKLLEQEEYVPFVEQFHQVPSAVTEGKLLHEEMKIQGPKVKIAVAWRHYSGARLREKGFGDQWQRKYIELPEFFGYCGSFSEYHFGARFPLVFPECPAEDDGEYYGPARSHPCFGAPRSFEGAHIRRAPLHAGSERAPKLRQADS